LRIEIIVAACPVVVHILIMSQNPFIFIYLNDKKHIE